MVTCWTGLETFPSTLSLLWGRVGCRKEVGWWNPITEEPGSLGRLLTGVTGEGGGGGGWLLKNAGLRDGCGGGLAVVSRTGGGRKGG